MTVKSEVSHQSGLFTSRHLQAATDSGALDTATASARGMDASLALAQTHGYVGPSNGKLQRGTGQKPPRVFLRKKGIKAKPWLMASPRTTTLHFPSLPSSRFPLILSLSHVQTTSRHQ